MKTLVLGIGNTLLGDDGVGVYVAQQLAAKISDTTIEVTDTAIDGVNLLDVIRHYERLIVIDAILDESAETGTIHRLTQNDIQPLTGTGAASHNLNLATTLKLGNRIFPGEIPEEVTIFAVTARNVDYVTETLTVNVQKAVPIVVDMVMRELGLYVS